MIVNKKQSGISPIVAAVTGVVVGAGIAVAGAVALKDEKNREKVKEMLTNAKDKAVGYMEDMQQQTADTKSIVEKKLGEGKEKVKKVANIS